MHGKQQKKGEKTSPMIQYVNADGNKMHDFFVVFGLRLPRRHGSLVLTETEKTVSSFCFFSNPWPLVTSCEAPFRSSSSSSSALQ